MTDHQQAVRIQTLASALRDLTESQLEFVENVVYQFREPYIRIERNDASDLVDPCFLRNFGDVLRIHHCFSRQSLSKDRFEYALEKTLGLCGRSATLAASSTNRGHDITIEGVPFSLKTQADERIQEDQLHISKFMELGKGRWPSSAKAMTTLRDMFLEHMENYERILSLRCLSKAPEHWWYELVEIPKPLLQEAAGGSFEIRRDTKQSARPGYCRVHDPDGNLKFELYFDAGSERKLQIRHLQKTLCLVHATWIFEAEPENAR